jgi:PEP-CTERM motif
MRSNFFHRSCQLTRQLATACALASASMCTMAATPSFVFSTGNADGKIGMASRPAGPAGIEIEAADDFILAQQTRINNASFTGLLPYGVSASDVVGMRLEIYKVFPGDSNDPPSGRVPTRVNSPADVALAERHGSDLSFSAALLSANFTAANSVLNGISPLPTIKTGGEGAVSGSEVRFDVTLNSPFDLQAGHYFFIPQVDLGGKGNFLWLSAAKPIVGGTGPFIGDLQAWIRNENLAPDWLRVGTDIVGAGAFNAAFSLSGDVVAVPEPQSYALMFAGLAAVGAIVRRRLGVGAGR